MWIETIWSHSGFILLQNEGKWHIWQFLHNLLQKIELNNMFHEVEDIIWQKRCLCCLPLLWVTDQLDNFQAPYFPPRLFQFYMVSFLAKKISSLRCCTMKFCFVCFWVNSSLFKDFRNKNSLPTTNTRIYTCTHTHTHTHTHTYAHHPVQGKEEDKHIY